MRLASTLVLAIFVSGTACTAPTVAGKSPTIDALTTLAFNQVAYDSSVNVTVDGKRNPRDWRDTDRHYLVRCHFYGVAGTGRERQKRKNLRYSFQPKFDIDGVKVAVVGDDQRLAQICSSPRLEEIESQSFAAMGNNVGYANYSGQWPSGTPAVSAKVQPLVNGRHRVTFVPVDSDLATLAVSSFSVDVEESQWMAIPFILRGTDTKGSAADEVSELLMFLKVD